MSRSRVLLYVMVLSQVALQLGCTSSPKEKSSSIFERPKINLSTDVFEWILSFDHSVRKQRMSSAYPTSGRVECREVTEIDGVYLCLFNSQGEMNYHLSRASCFIEGSFCNHKKGTVLNLYNRGFLQSLWSITGHNFLGKDLWRYYQAVEQKCKETQGDKKFCFSPVERAFFDQFLLPKMKKDPNFALITFARFARSSWFGTLTHEIMHAQYFQQPKYKKIVDQYWSELPESEKQKLRNQLGKAYDKNDEYLMKNEFQAYILQPNAKNEKALLKNFVDRHRRTLMARLNGAGISPIQVELNVK